MNPLEVQREALKASNEASQTMLITSRRLARIMRNNPHGFDGTQGAEAIEALCDAYESQRLVILTMLKELGGA